MIDDKLPTLSTPTMTNSETIDAEYTTSEPTFNIDIQETPMTHDATCATIAMELEVKVLDDDQCTDEAGEFDEEERRKKSKHSCVQSLPKAVGRPSTKQLVPSNFL